MIGSLCLAGIFAGRHRHRGWHGHSWHQHGGRCDGAGAYGMGGYEGGAQGGYETHGDGMHSGWSPRGRSFGGFGRRFWLRGVFQRLDATPAQEKAMIAALQELDALRDKTRSDMKAARKDVAEAFRSPVFNEEAVGAATARIEAVMDEARKTGISIFAKVHDALDEHQRRVVSDWISDGLQSFGSNHGGHAYRGQC